jgi:hypothetical protein
MQMERVAVWEGIEVKRELATIEEAANLLQYEWPEQHCGTRKHMEAQIAVMAAQDGSGSVEDARKAFVLAAEEAKVLAHPVEYPPRKPPG